MHRAISRTILSLLAVVWLLSPALSLASSGKRLLTINGEEYTNEDFRNWWRHWNDKNTLEFPATPSDFIDFQLMVQQGVEMGYDTLPNYQKKLAIFLQVRAMMALKYDEIDSKVAVTDEDLKKYFDDNYSTVWDLQILAFDSESKAQKAYATMLPLNGQEAGRMVLADLVGAGVDEKPETYDESKVSAADFPKNKREAWLPVVRKLKVGEVCKPFLNEDNNKYILLRVDKIQPAEEGVFEEKRRKMTEILNKEKRNILTSNLIASLRKKYNVQINQELLKAVKFDVEYPQEFLSQVVVSMDGFKAVVYDVIYNVTREKKVRTGIPDEQLKDMVLNSIISQTLINKESLSRGYENRPPLSWTYGFYKQNRLRLEVEAGLMSGIVPTDQELRNYYDLNVADFTVREKVSYSLLKAGEEVLRNIWVGTLSGGDFTDLAQKYSLDATIQHQDLVLFPPSVVNELKKLDKGSVSTPFPLDGGFGLLKLYDRSPGKVTPFEQVKAQLVEQLKKVKFEAIKVDYLNKLKSRSKIDINEGVWNALERQYGKKD